jgi:hypothetical protein
VAWLKNSCIHWITTRISHRIACILSHLSPPSSDVSDVVRLVESRSQRRILQQPTAERHRTDCDSRTPRNTSPPPHLLPTSFFRARPHPPGLSGCSTRAARRGGTSSMSSRSRRSCSPRPKPWLSCPTHFSMSACLGCRRSSSSWADRARSTSSTRLVSARLSTRKACPELMWFLSRGEQRDGEWPPGLGDRV